LGSINATVQENLVGYKVKEKDEDERPALGNNSYSYKDYADTWGRRKNQKLGFGKKWQVENYQD
jgi:hypothetical protein